MLQSEDIIKILWLLAEMISSHGSILQASSVKMGLSFGKAFLIISLFKMASHAVLLWSLESSVKM